MRRRLLSFAPLVTAAVAVTLSACGSGSPSSPALPAPPASPTLSPTASPTPTPTPTPVALTYVFPVAGKASYGRTHHDYPAADIIAACGLPVVAPVDGVILELSRVDTFDPKVDAGDTRGGRNISILGDDGVRYYGAHLETVEPASVPGARVRAGQKLATVGRTGKASVCHLHFGISPLCARLADWWVRRGVIWPADYLDAWRKQENRSPAKEISAWQTANGCPATPPST